MQAPVCGFIVDRKRVEREEGSGGSDDDDDGCMIDWVDDDNADDTLSLERRMIIGRYPAGKQRIEFVHGCFGIKGSFFAGHFKGRAGAVFFTLFGAQAMSAGRIFCVPTPVCHAFWVLNRVCKRVRAKYFPQLELPTWGNSILHTHDCIPVTDAILRNFSTWNPSLHRPYCDGSGNFSLFYATFPPGTHHSTDLTARATTVTKENNKLCQP